MLSFVGDFVLAESSERNLDKSVSSLKAKQLTELLNDLNKICFELIKLYLEKKLLIQKQNKNFSMPFRIRLRALNQLVNSDDSNFEIFLGNLQKQELDLVLPKTTRIIREELEMYGRGAQTWKTCDNGLFNSYRVFR